VILIPNLEELLIDFRELVGEHSGENLADAVWKTVEMYGIEGRVIIKPFWLLGDH
jgi:hypothetical protein